MGLGTAAAPGVAKAAAATAVADGAEAGPGRRTLVADGGWQGRTVAGGYNTATEPAAAVAGKATPATAAAAKAPAALRRRRQHGGSYNTNNGGGGTAVNSGLPHPGAKASPGEPGIGEGNVKLEPPKARAARTNRRPSPRRQRLTTTRLSQQCQWLLQAAPRLGLHQQQCL